MTGRAVVIGGTGQVGRAIARRLLDAGWAVDVVGRGNTPVPADVTACVVHRADRTDGAALAALTGDDTRLLVDCACFTAGHARTLLPLLRMVESTVMISAKAVYVDDRGRHVNSPDPPHFDEPIVESHPTVPPVCGDDYHSRQGYGRCKVAAEQVLLDDGHPVTVLRPSKVHGPGAARPLEWVFVKRVLDGRPAVLLAGRGRGADHPTGAANLASLVETVATHPGRRVLNIADPDVPDGRQIAATIAAHFGHDWREVLLPDDADPALGRHPWDRRPPIVLDTSAAVALGYRPVGTHAETIGPTLDWLAARAVRTRHGHVLPAGLDAAGFESMIDYPAEDRYLGEIRRAAPPAR